KGALKEKIEANKEIGLLSKKLATILLDCPIQFDQEQYELNTPDFEKVAELFNELEFRRMTEQFQRIFSSSNTAPQIQTSQAIEEKSPAPKKKNIDENQTSLF